MISKEEVQRIAKLARLELTGKETEKMQKDMSAILDYFTILKGAPDHKGGIAPAGGFTKTRADTVLEKSASLANNLVQAAPDKKEGYIKVKSIL